MKGFLLERCKTLENLKCGLVRGEIANSWHTYSVRVSALTGEK